MTRTSPFLSLAAVLAAASTALAQDAAPQTAQSSGDYRWAIYTSCTVVFVAIGVYLVATHGRAAAAANELGALERRLDELEASNGK